MKKYTKYWFTLIETLVSILLLSFIIIVWFQTLNAVSIWKISLFQKADIEKQAFYFSEKLFEEIKRWWTIDYEEYFNRRMLWTSFLTWWHFGSGSWFWNFWYNWTVWTANYKSFYIYCISGNWAWNKISWTWCINDKNILWHSTGLTKDFALSWKNMVYWQYALQFIDYNWNHNWDFWDENWDWDIRFDEDDKYIWDWPIAFTWWTNLRELYLISWDKTKRTFFRRNIKQDPEAPTWYTCNATWTISWSWCIWNIEFLKLDWYDFWTEHDYTAVWKMQYDWIIDTWVIDPNFDSAFTWVNWLAPDLWYTIAWSNNNNYRVSLFPDDISVNNFEVYLYPQKDIKLAWKDFTAQSNISPYLKINIQIWPWWKTRKKLKGNVNDINISTTINLSEIYSKY